MRPPPTMTLADLERHPLRGVVTRRNINTHNDDDAAVDTKHLDDGPLSKFIPLKTHYTDVKSLLQSQLVAAEARMLTHKQGRQGKSPVHSDIPLINSEEVNPKQPIAEVEEKAFYLTDVPLSSRLEGDSADPKSNTTSRGRTGSLLPTSSVPVALSVSSLGPEFDEQCLDRDPKDFRKAGQESRHAQHYRHRTVEVRSIGLPKPTSEESSAYEVGLFMKKLKNRDHHFNNAVMDELRRAREAQRMFFNKKADEIDRTLSYGDRRSAPVPQLLGDVRKTVRKEAVAKDQGERLEVFFDHLRRLDRYATPRFPKDDIALLSELLAATREVVEAKDGHVAPSDFGVVWRAFKRLFTRESIMQLHARELLRKLSVMFGISHETFRSWLHLKMRRYDARDLQAVFRSEDVAMGKEAHEGARIRLALTGGRHLCTKEWTARSQTYVRVCAEELVVCSPTVYDAGTKTTVAIKAKPALLQLEDESSLVRIQVVEDDRAVGEGSFVVTGFAPGRPLKMWLPTHGAGAPHAEVEMQIEVLPPRVTNSPSRSRFNASAELQQEASILAGSSDDDM